MKRLFLIVALLAIPTVAQTQDAPKPAAVSDIDKDGDGKASAEETKALVDKDVSVTETVGELGDVVEAAKDLKGKSGTPLALAIAMFLAALFKGVLSLIKVLAKNTTVFVGRKGKTRLKYTTVALGALAAAGAGVANSLGAGLPWYDVAIIACGGPGAMVVHTLWPKKTDEANG